MPHAYGGQERAGHLTRGQPDVGQLEMAVGRSVLPGLVISHPQFQPPQPAAV